MPEIGPDAQVERIARPTVHAETSLPIYWINDEWAVTSFGLESMVPRWPYFIDAARLGEVRRDRAEWPAHMEAKGWTDPRLFLEAFLKALEVHKIPHGFDINHERARANVAADLLAAHAEMARRRKERDGPGLKATPLEVLSLDDIKERDDEVESLIDQGFRAPPFPASCVREI